MLQQKIFAKWILQITTSCIFFPFLIYVATGSLWHSPQLEHFLLQWFPFFRLIRPLPFALLFILLQIACFRIATQIKPTLFTFWIGIGFIIIAIIYLLLGSFFSLGYFLGGTLLLFHDNTLQFKRISFFDHQLEGQF
ncbi:MAG: hypothetical protein ACRCWD_05065 [Culicoidibacterales bacterium]